MDSTPVNWEALDSLVLDFAKSENLIEHSAASCSPPSSPSSTTYPSSSPSSSSSSYLSRLVIRMIRRCIMSGDIDGAIDILQLHAPEVLNDRRLLFRLQKQKFIELLRTGTDEDRESALGCLRGALAPVALDAYPEAYEEFKHILLALIFKKDDKISPVADEWSEKRRLDIAGLLCSILRAQLHAYDPIFAMTLRYLISIHRIFCLRQGLTSPISDLTKRLLFEDRDLQATPQESLYEAPPFDEVDIQALAHAVELTRQGAIDSLRFAKGNLFEAFQNELCRMNMDLGILDELVYEYCIYRGIVEITQMPLPDNGTNKFSDGETSASSIEMEGKLSIDTGSKQGDDSELRFSPETTSTHEDCSTSDVNQTETYSGRFRRGRSHTIACHNRRKRWRGRGPDVLVSTVESCEKELKYSAVGSTRQIEEDQMSCHSSLEHVDDKKIEVILEMKELAHKGMVTEIMEEVNIADPDFFVQNPMLLFQLKQVEFLKLVTGGNYSEALKVASSHLGPLALTNPDLLKPLKETLFTLLKPNEDALVDSANLSTLATSLQVAMGGKFGIEEPQLMRIMRATLYTHVEWFKLQMCKDRFEGLLRIDCLKETDAHLLGDCTLKLCTDSSTHGQDIISSGNKLPGDTSPASVTSRDGCDESAVIKVMEFLDLPRADAIHLLAQYNGNAEAVIQQIFT